MKLLTRNNRSHEQGLYHDRYNIKIFTNKSQRIDHLYQYMKGVEYQNLNLPEGMNMQVVMGKMAVQMIIVTRDAKQMICS